MFFEVLSREFTDASGATHVEQDSGSGSDNVMSIVSLLRELLALAMCIGPSFGDQRWRPVQPLCRSLTLTGNEAPQR